MPTWIKKRKIIGIQLKSNCLVSCINVDKAIIYIGT